jgi:YD repeat-containing protein
VNRSFALDAAALALLAAIALFTLALLGHVRAEPQTTRTFRDSFGREIGRATTNGNTTTFYDNLGREAGRASRSGNGTTFYDNFGRETGRVSRGR